MNIFISQEKKVRQSVSLRNKSIYIENLEIVSYKITSSLIKEFNSLSFILIRVI